MTIVLLRRFGLTGISLATLVVALAVVGLQLPLAAADGIPKDLGGDDRFVAAVSTDRPLYKPGDTIWGRAVLLHAFTHAPRTDSTLVQFQVKSAKGDVVHEGPGVTEDGVAAFFWEIPKGQAGGSFKLVASFPANGYPEAEASLDVRAYRVPRLNTEIQFVRDAYGAGDEVAAAFSATRAEGGVPAGATAQAIATVDGRNVSNQVLTLDAEGAATIRFTLPEKILDGRGSLVVIVDDGGVRETAAKTLPIVASRLDVELFPEGGDLVAGLPTRLYIQARTSVGKPADCAGRILDGQGQLVASFRTEHEGRGRVALTPKADAQYKLVIDEPAGITETVDLPAVTAAGAVLTSTKDVFGADAPVSLKVMVSEAGTWRLGLFARDREVAALAWDLVAGEVSEPTITPPGWASGVLRATLFDPAGTPRAERLIFRRPRHSLSLEVVADAERVSPRGKVRVTLRTKGVDGKPGPAVVGLSVVDDSVLETVERRERAPRLPAAVLLGNDVRELADAHVYLGSEPEAPLALDLLLGTQGWRRFCFEKPASFVADHGQAARRALALRVTPPAQKFARGRLGGMRRMGLDMPRDGAAMNEPVEEGAPLQEGVPPPAPQGAAVPEAAPMPAPPVKNLEKEARLDRVQRNDGLEAPPMEQNQERAKRAMNPADEMPEADEEQPGPDGRALRRLAQPMRDRNREFAWRREFAHRAQPFAEGATARTDFAQTLYWHAGIGTGEKGEFSFEFDAADSITSFRVRADAVGPLGALGFADTLVEVRRPFYIEPKLPLEVTAGDRIRVPVALVNGSAEDLDLTLRVTAGEGLDAAALEAKGLRRLTADERGLMHVPLTVGAFSGETTLQISGRSGPFADDVIRTLRVVPRGFPIEVSFGGRLEGSATHTLQIPEKLDASSLRTTAVVFPSPLASLVAALEALLREPYGCFEQASSSTYPNIMVMQYLQTHHGVDPALVARASDLLDKGYKKLSGYECTKKGYEWFGSDPGHEALTAYGLMEFTDMAQVYPVDDSMVARTRDWLLARRDGKGGFQRNAKALDTFGRAPQDITDAYITWALTESGVEGIEKEIAAVRKAALASDDPYLLALAANVLFNVEDEAAGSVAKRLAERQEETGRLVGTRTSITGSGGDSLAIETSSLAVLAWLRSPEHTAHTERAMGWLLERCKAGRFGATQATILALRAINAYDAAHAVPKKAGAVLLVVDGEVIDERAFSADRQGPIELPAFAELLTPGEHTVELRMVNGSPMPYAITVSYHSDQPASASDCSVRLKTSLAKATVAEGQTVEVAVSVSNVTDKGLPMCTAIVGLPGGLEARTDQLKELVSAGTIGAFETRGREVILYWRDMAPKASVELHLEVVAAVPGQYTGPASRAYLYYTDELKHWTPGLEVTVTGR